MHVVVPEEFEAVIRKRCESRGITATEAVRQLISLSWATWKDRGGADRVRRHRAAQRTFRERLAPGVKVTWQDNLKNDYTGILVGKHAFNKALWDVDTLTGPCAGILASVPVGLLKPST